MWEGERVGGSEGVIVGEVVRGERARCLREALERRGDWGVVSFEV